MAMTYANGRLIDGRVIRVERASARREFNYLCPRYFGGG